MIYQWIQSKMTKKSVLMVLGIMVVSQAVLFLTPFGKAFDASAGIPNLMMFSNLDAWQEVMHIQSDAGLQSLKFQLYVDFVIVFCYSFLYSALMVKMTESLNIPRIIKYILSELPFFAGLSNIVGNIALLIVAYGMPHMWDGILQVGVIVTTLKYIFIGPVLLCTIVLGIIQLLKARHPTNPA